MRKAVSLLIVFYFILLKIVFSCSCYPHYPFCYVHDFYPLVIMGEIVDSTDHSIRFKKVEILKGVENRDTITIWDSVDYDCTGIISMKATGLGKIGDTILIALSKIDTTNKIFSEEKANDYRRPPYLCWTTSLLLKNDTLYGVINGPTIGIIAPIIPKISYNEFISFWDPPNGGSCTSLYRNDYSKTNQIHNLYYDADARTLKISSTQFNKFDLRIYNNIGLLLFQLTHNNESVINLSNFANEVLFVEIENNTGEPIYKNKVVIY